MSKPLSVNINIITFISPIIIILIHRAVIWISMASFLASPLVSALKYQNLDNQCLCHRDAMEEYRMQLEDQLRRDVKLRPARELMMSEVERRLNKSFRLR
jgi:hypothetical protein